MLPTLIFAHVDVCYVATRLLTLRDVRTPRLPHRSLRLHTLPYVTAHFARYTRARLQLLHVTICVPLIRLRLIAVYVPVVTVVTRLSYVAATRYGSRYVLPLRFVDCYYRTNTRTALQPRLRLRLRLLRLYTVARFAVYPTRTFTGCGSVRSRLCG